MKFKKKVTETIKEYIKISRHICDLCKKDIHHDYDGGWERSEITIEASIGNSYPESDDRFTDTLDVCKTCFETQLKPLIEQTYNVKFHNNHTDEYEYNSYPLDEEI